MSAGDWNTQVLNQLADFGERDVNSPEPPDHRIVDDTGALGQFGDFARVLDEHGVSGRPSLGRRRALLDHRQYIRDVGPRLQRLCRFGQRDLVASLDGFA